MKSLFLFIILLFLFPNLSNSQTHAEVPVDNYALNIDAYIVEFDSSVVKNFKFLLNNRYLKFEDYILARKKNRDSVFFAINGGIFDASFRPQGLFIADGQEVNPVDLGNGNGNFYLKPNGIFLITHTAVSVIESSELHQYSNIINATQSGPLLVLNGQIHPKFTKGSQNKKIRCGVGVYNENNRQKIVFAISNEPVNFYDFATFFKEKFNCQNALCLESDGCVMFIPFVNRANANNEHKVGTYIIYEE